MEETSCSAQAASKGCTFFKIKQGFTITTQRAINLLSLRLRCKLSGFQITIHSASLTVPWLINLSSIIQVPVCVSGVASIASHATFKMAVRLVQEPHRKIG
jgi:hypothetical protein